MNDYEAAREALLRLIERDRGARVAARWPHLARPGPNWEEAERRALALPAPGGEAALVEALLASPALRRLVRELVEDELADFAERRTGGGGGDQRTVRGGRRGATEGVPRHRPAGAT